MTDERLQFAAYVFIVIVILLGITAVDPGVGR